MEVNKKKFTDTGTDIEDVKRKNAESGMSYNEVKEYIAKTRGSYDSSMYSDLDPRELKNKDQQ